MRSSRAVIRARAQAVSGSGDFGGCSPGLLAQRSRFSITSRWLARRAFGALGSSDSLRGSLISSVMTILLAEIMTLKSPGININLLFLLHNFTNLRPNQPLMELACTYKVE
jgi:hypothetical protein